MFKCLLGEETQCAREVVDCLVSVMLVRCCFKGRRQKLKLCSKI